MSTTEPTAPGGLFVVGVVLAALAGAAVFGYGLLPPSPHSAVAGSRLSASRCSCRRLVATERVGGRLGLSAATRRTLSLSLAALAVVLLVAFVVVNFASAGPGATETSG